MALNQGIQKYRSAAGLGSETASKGRSAAGSSAKARVPARTKAAKPAPRAKTETEEEDRHLASEEREDGGISYETLNASEEVEQAIVDAYEAEESSSDEAQLQAELARELVQDAVKTQSMVKEDFSPVNRSRDDLVVEYAPLIKYIAQKIAARLPANIELDDLISSGVIGLMDAIDKYDATRDNKFKTYAEFRIRGAILDELRAQDWVPRSVREKAKQLERCYQKIEQAKGRQATDEEVCAELGLSSEEYYDLLNQVKSVSLLSYDDVASFSKQDKRTLHGFAEGASKAATPYSEVNTMTVKKMIADAIRDLPEKQRLVLSLYYYEDLNLKEIGRVLDVTESRVSQLHTQAIIRLKSRLRGHWDEFLALMS